MLRFQVDILWGLLDWIEIYKLSDRDLFFLYLLLSAYNFQSFL